MLSVLSGNTGHATRAPPAKHPPLHDALPISDELVRPEAQDVEDGSVELRERAPAGALPEDGVIATAHAQRAVGELGGEGRVPARSEEHTSGLQSRENLVCRLLLEKKKAVVLR